MTEKRSRCSVAGIMAAGLLPLAFVGVLLASCAGGRASSPGEAAPQDILTASLTYLKSHHSDAAVYLTDNISFTQITATGKGRLGYTGVTYTGGAWNISIGHPVVPDYSWEITANYNGGQIVWVGSWKNGILGEVSYAANLP